MRRRSGWEFIVFNLDPPLCRSQAELARGAMTSPLERYAASRPCANTWRAFPPLKIDFVPSNSADPVLLCPLQSLLLSADCGCGNSHRGAVRPTRFLDRGAELMRQRLDDACAEASVGGLVARFLP